MIEKLFYTDEEWPHTDSWVETGSLEYLDKQAIKAQLSLELYTDRVIWGYQAEDDSARTEVRIPHNVDTRLEGLINPEADQ